jgi:hypothetical protein
LGLVTTFHSDPSHDATNVIVTFPGPETRLYPTAAHEENEKHDTDFSSRELLEVGLGTVDHDPSKNNTNALFPAFPAATHSVALTHDTEFRTLPLCPELGLDSIVHADPSHDITNV